MILGVGVGVNNRLICPGRIRWGRRPSPCWCSQCAPPQQTTTSIGIFMWSLALTGSRYSRKMSSKQLILKFKNLTSHSSIPYFLLFNLNSFRVIQGFIRLFLWIGNYPLTNSNILAFYLQDVRKCFCCIDALAEYLPSNISWTRTIGTSPSTYILSKVVLLRRNTRYSQSQMLFIGFSEAAAALLWADSSSWSSWCSYSCSKSLLTSLIARCVPVVINLPMRGSRRPRLLTDSAEIFILFNLGLNMNMAEDCSVGGIMIEQQNSGFGQKWNVFYLLCT
jgi:hypothetical protein